MEFGELVTRSGEARRGKRATLKNGWARRRLKRPAGNAGRGSGGRRRPDVLALWATGPIELTRWPTGPIPRAVRMAEPGVGVAGVISGVIWDVGAGWDRTRPRATQQHDAGAGAPSSGPSDEAAGARRWGRRPFWAGRRGLGWLEVWRAMGKRAGGEICRRCSGGLPPEICPTGPRATGGGSPRSVRRS